LLTIKIGKGRDGEKLERGGGSRWIAGMNAMTVDQELGSKL
jgi:hypothetical protein